MQLRELQRAFQARLLTGQSGIEAELAGAKRPDFLPRVAVYADGYYGRLVEALGTTYPALQAALGEAEFERVISEFIAAEPSRYYSVRDYGERVGDHLARGGTSIASQVLAQLARWEYAYPCFDVGRFRAIGRFQALQRQARRDGRRLYFAGDYLVGPTMEGAFASAARAAEAVLSDLGVRSPPAPRS